jgi:hypothetical protein
MQSRQHYPGVRTPRISRGSWCLIHWTPQILLWMFILLPSNSYAKNLPGSWCLSSRTALRLVRVLD